MKITAKDRERQFPDVLHESGNKYITCNTMEEDKQMSSKKSLPQNTHGDQLKSRQIFVTEAAVSTCIAGAL